MRKVEWIFLLLGLVLFVALLDRVGWAEILGQLQKIGLYFLVILLVSACRYLARVGAWRRAFPGERNLPSFAQMFQVHVAGETLNYLTLAGPLLGEPAKAALLRERMPLAVGLGGRLIEGGVYAITSGWLILIGLVLGLLEMTVNEEMQRTGWLAAGLLGATLLAAWWLLRRQVRFLSAGLNWLSRGPLAAWAERRRARLEQIEQQLLRFYALHASDFRAVFFWNTLAQVFAMLEIYIILGAMGLRVSWVYVLILEAWAKVIKALFFFVPGRVGTDEGGTGLLFELLGLGLAAGVGLALVRRLRALLWSAAGLLFLSRYALRGPA